MIRQATLDDIPAIARVHYVCFPNSYSSQLSLLKSAIGGGNLLETFYMEYMNDNPEIFVVADDKDRGIAGFCMGYYMDKDDQMQNFLHKNRLYIVWKTFLLLLMGNKLTWNKLLSRLRHKPNVSDWSIVNDKYEYIQDNERGDLLSVCVLPEFRGKGYAQEMMDYFLGSMKQHGRKLCLLSVDKDNVRARRYYERNGFEIYRKNGETGLTYMKLL